MLLPKSQLILLFSYFSMTLSCIPTESPSDEMEMVDMLIAYTTTAAAGFNNHCYRDHSNSTNIHNYSRIFYYFYDLDYSNNNNDSKVSDSTYRNGNCYLLNTGADQHSYAGSQTLCNINLPGSTLAAINSQAEAEFIHCLYAAAYPPAVCRTYYLGGMVTAPATDPSDFSWDDGSSNTWANWAAGYPDGNTGNLCIIATVTCPNTDSIDQWMNIDCTTLALRVCKIAAP